MLVFIAFVAIIAIIFLVVFSSSIYHFLYAKYLQRKLDKEKEKISDLYNNYRFHYKDSNNEDNHDCLGLGSSMNSDVEFSVAHRNQDVAVRPVLKLINKLTSEENSGRDKRSV